jgi:alkylation response protein AidB-like acyl-CoA dehydrogenase
MDTATVELLTQILGRAVREADPSTVDAALDRVGWLDALAAEGTAVAALLFTEQGAANATSGALDDLLAVTLGLPTGTGTAFVLPAFGRHGAPGRASGGQVIVSGLGTARMAGADTALVVTGDTDGHWGVVIPTGLLRVTPVGGVDPRSGLVSVEGTDVPAEDRAPVDWTRALTAARVALAHELIGASRAMLVLARDHALTRVQFGHPIGFFQAVRHRLADSLVAVEAAEAAAAMALEAVGAAEQAPNSGGPPCGAVDARLLAGMAKALAGRGARTVARHCQQVLAGVGFTAEHGFHHYFRRVLVLDGLFGDARTLTRELGEELLRGRRMPAVPPL